MEGERVRRRHPEDRPRPVGCPGRLAHRERHRVVRPARPYRGRRPLLDHRPGAHRHPRRQRDAAHQLRRRSPRGWAPPRTLGVIDGPGSAHDDAALVEAARGGDREALARLLRAPYDRLHALCRRLTGDDADALDACQEALIAIARRLDRFDGRSTFATWAYRVTANACFDELRRRRRRPVVAIADDTPSSVDVSETAALRLDIDAALVRLPMEYRAAVVLRDLCDLSYDEIGDALGIPAGTVRSRI